MFLKKLYHFLTSTQSINYFNKPEFTNKLSSCCHNPPLCLLATFCYCIPIGLSAVASKFFKSRCLATCSGCFCPCLILCGIRENTRKMFNVNGTVVGDCCSSFLCCLCLNCQMARELGVYDWSGKQNFSFNLNYSIMCNIKQNKFIITYLIRIIFFNYYSNICRI